MVPLSACSTVLISCCVAVCVRKSSCANMRAQRRRSTASDMPETLKMDLRCKVDSIVFSKKKGFAKVRTKTRDSQTMSAPTLTPPPMKAVAHYSTPSPFATPTSPPPVVRQNATAARPDRAVNRVLFPTQPTHVGTHVMEAETDTDTASDTA